jgi:hypothetical protein
MEGFAVDPGRSVLWLPRIRFTHNHGELSRAAPSPRMLRPGGGMAPNVSTEAVERLRQRE